MRVRRSVHDHRSPLTASLFAAAITIGCGGANTASNVVRGATAPPTAPPVAQHAPISTLESRAAPPPPALVVHPRTINLALALSNCKGMLHHLEDAAVYVRWGTIDPKDGLLDLDILQLSEDGFHDGRALLDGLAQVLRKEDPMLFAGLSGDTKRLVFHALLGDIRTATDTLFTHEHGKWTKSMIINFADARVELRNGTLLYDAPYFKEQTLLATGPLPQGMVLPKLARGNDETRCEHRVDRQVALAALPDGGVLGVGPECVDGGSTVPLLIETWAHGNDRPTIAELPNSATRDPVNVGARMFRAFAPDNVWFAAAIPSSEWDRAYLAHFDGKSWTDVSPAAQVLAFDVLFDDVGGVFVFPDYPLDKAAYRRDPASGNWTEIAVPPSTGNEFVVARPQRGPGGVYSIVDGHLYFLPDGANEWDELVPRKDLGVGYLTDFGWTPKGKLYVVSQDAVYIDGKVSAVIDLDAVDARREKSKSG